MVLVCEPGIVFGSKDLSFIIIIERAFCAACFVAVTLAMIGVGCPGVYLLKVSCVAELFSCPTVLE